MELALAVNVALVSWMYLSLLTSPATGYSSKCKGKWLIHACLGGNGKRSDPSMSPEPKLSTSLLRRVLESDPQQMNQFLGVIEDSERPDLIEEKQLLPLGVVGYRALEGEDDGLNVNKVNMATIRRYLNTLKLQHDLRNSGDDFK